MDNGSIPITFSRAELWMLHSVVRHEAFLEEQWSSPLASEALNEDIALALNAVEARSLDEYTLLMDRKMLLVVDAAIKADAKTADGASGKVILLKTFAARRRMSEGALQLGPERPGDDRTFMEATQGGVVFGESMRRKSDRVEGEA